MRQDNLAARAGRWSAGHRRLALFGWLGFVLVAFMIGRAVGQQHVTAEQQGNGDSRVARQLIADHFPKQADEMVLVQGRRTGVGIGHPVFDAAIRDVVRRLRALPSVRDVRSPLIEANFSQLSFDGRSALVKFVVPGGEEAAKDRVGASMAATAAAQRARPSIRIEQFGAASANKELSKVFDSDFQKAERTSLPITLVILLVAFGALVAAGIPLLLGLTAVFATLGMVAPISQLVPFDQTGSSVIFLIGLAVGVDYSMFYLRRMLEERNAGRDNADALAVAAATSGRAVLTSGLTVLIAMSGMFLAGNVVFRSFAIGTILVVAVSMLGSITVLPAVLAMLGDKVERGRMPIVARRRHRAADAPSAWGWIVDRVLRHPIISVVLSAGALIVLAIPALHMRTVESGLAGLPRSIAVMKTYDRIEAAFPGGPIPAVVAVKAPDVTTPAVQAGIAHLRRAALANDQMGGPVTLTVSPDHRLARVEIPLEGNGTDARSERALTTLRDRLIPSTVERPPGVDAYVTGATADSKDFNDRMRARLPFVFAFVLGLAFLLLLHTFRSIVIPLKAIALNMLSVGAAYGILTWVFQDAHGRSLLGFRPIGGIVDWLPLFLFVVLFGLSMDYHVFILSRVREAHDRGLPTDQAVAQAIKSTAGVVTSAAVVMVAVFGIFATLSAIEFKMTGVGLAVAVLLDATIVRAVLLPAGMKLLGDWNWYLPRFLSHRPTWPAHYGSPHRG
jgi:RND superfamily putative drug exporter